MGENAVSIAEAREIKKKIGRTTMVIILLAIGAGVGLFFVSAPAHAFAEKPETTSFAELPGRINAQSVAPEAGAAALGESIDFSSTLLSMRSEAAQKALKTKYRLIRGESAVNNVEINTEYDVPVAREARFVLEAPSEVIDEKVVVVDEEEKKERPVVSNRNTGEGSGSARMKSIRSNIPSEFLELFDDLIRRVEIAEGKWVQFVKGNRSKETHLYLKEAKVELVYVREGLDRIREIYENIAGIDKVASDVARQIYDINKTYIGK
ncbi:MAG: hypothetical protein KDB07_04915 [Planctomycetes bacterium]|nr:hypothetical protein [Planctomycetota bacterium]